MAKLLLDHLKADPSRFFDQVLGIVGALLTNHILQTLLIIIEVKLTTSDPSAEEALAVSQNIKAYLGDGAQD